MTVRDFSVSRYCRVDPVTKRPAGDFLTVGDTDLGGFRDLVEAEYQRAAKERPDNPAFAMRRMFFTGSPFGREILELAKGVRPALAKLS